MGGEVTFPSPPMAVELLARDARASVPCPRPSERVGLAQVARRASDPLAPRSAWSLAGNSRHAVGAACVLVPTSMSSARPFHRKVRPLTALVACAARCLDGLCAVQNGAQIRGGNVFEIEKVTGHAVVPVCGVSHKVGRAPSAQRSLRPLGLRQQRQRLRRPDQSRHPKRSAVAAIE